MDIIVDILDKISLLSNEVQILLILCVTYCFVTWCNRGNMKKFSLDTLVNDKNKSKRIRQMMVELRIKTGADRAKWFRLHNGQTDAMNICFKKCSCEDEVIGNGLSVDYPSLQNLPARLINVWIDNFKCGRAVFDDVELYNTPMHVDTYFHFKQQGTKYICVAPLITNGALAGFIDVCYNSEINFDDEKRNEIKKMLLDTANLIVEEQKNT